MTERSEGMDVGLDPVVGLRLQMATEGWESEDRITNAGWRDGMGYSIWFQRWDWHGQQTIKLTGSQACYHAHTPHLTPEGMLRATSEAAARARRAYANFEDYPPQQMADGTLKVCRILTPNARAQPRICRSAAEANTSAGAPGWASC